DGPSTSTAHPKAEYTTATVPLPRSDHFDNSCLTEESIQELLGITSTWLGGSSSPICLFCFLGWRLIHPGLVERFESFSNVVILRHILNYRNAWERFACGSVWYVRRHNADQFWRVIKAAESWAATYPIYCHSINEILLLSFVVVADSAGEEACVRRMHCREA
ncbi:hypothetical protein, partial [Pseudoxanthomonas koreensis]|uniref:hypothetical protein n=1 Tax=Pseudoxanthomonas koreensis TaxID=266061 RepID=UPI001EE4D344